MKYANLGEDIETVELVGLLIDAEWVPGGRFRDVLTAGIFIKDVRSNELSVTGYAMRGMGPTSSPCATKHASAARGQPAPVFLMVEAGGIPILIPMQESADVP